MNKILILLMFCAISINAYAWTHANKKDVMSGAETLYVGGNSDNEIDGKKCFLVIKDNGNVQLSFNLGQLEYVNQVGTLAVKFGDNEPKTYKYRAIGKASTVAALQFKRDSLKIIDGMKNNKIMLVEIYTYLGKRKIYMFDTSNFNNYLVENNIVIE